MLILLTKTQILIHKTQFNIVKRTKSRVKGKYQDKEEATITCCLIQLKYISGVQRI